MCAQFRSKRCHACVRARDTRPLLVSVSRVGPQLNRARTLSRRHARKCANINKCINAHGHISVRAHVHAMMMVSMARQCATRTTAICIKVHLAHKTHAHTDGLGCSECARVLMNVKHYDGGSVWGTFSIRMRVQ